MEIDFKEYPKEMEMLKEVLTEKQINALCGILVKVIFASMFGYEPQMSETEKLSDEKYY